MSKLQLPDLTFYIVLFVLAQFRARPIISRPKFEEADNIVSANKHQACMPRYNLQQYS